MVNFTKATWMPWGVRAPRGRPYACAQKHTGPSGPPSGPEGSQEVEKIVKLSKNPPSHFKALVCSLKTANVWMQISTVMNYKGREPPSTCQKFGSGVAHTLISRQEVYDAMQSEGLQLRSGEVTMQSEGLQLRSGEVKGNVA